MRCNFCVGPAHEATGCRYGPSTIACRACTVEFWNWVKAHTNKKARRRSRRDGSLKVETALTFYEAATHMKGGVA